MTALVQLVAIRTDSLDYTTYVFECLEDKMIAISKYIMCVRYPNWNHRQLTLGEIGFLNYKEIKAGTDTWFDGYNMVPYKYDTIQFISFIEKPENSNQEYIM